LEAGAKDSAEAAKNLQAKIEELEAVVKASSEAASKLALNITEWKNMRGQALADLGKYMAPIFSI